MAEKPASPCHNVVFHVHFIHYANTPTARTTGAMVTSPKPAHSGPYPKSPSSGEENPSYVRNDPVSHCRGKEKISTPGPPW